MSPRLFPSSIDLAAPPSGQVLGLLAQRVDEVLATFLTERAKELAAIDAALNPVADSVTALVEAGGKRLRPAFVWWGAMAAAAEPDPEILKPAGAAELLHTFALIHDDIMDKSATRRGLPAVHSALAEHHREAGMAGDAEWFGTGGGILAGDMVFVWADMLFEAAALDPVALARSRTVFAHLRTEVMAGQYLDLRLSGLPEASEEDSLRVSLLKSGRYTVTRPLQMGAALGAPDDALDRALVEFGDAIGVAFQLRDDILGLMGDPDETGKGALEDVREGKRTMLVLRARDLATPAQRDVLAGVLGDPAAADEGVDQVRQVVTETGALDQVEASLSTLRATAEAAIDEVREPARSALLELAAEAIDRTS
ncbi:polyprenyl synthetase family protein [Euzebya tangerina]|uniref:polyprenyl synthetase family protein n=1 Tax=Euzebya tangerina TaxID=591198 RepID=UPI0013C2D414|nr:polyprenyl synthetase family protein [Euzebya tangerina]